MIRLKVCHRLTDLQYFEDDCTADCLNYPGQIWVLNRDQGFKSLVVLELEIGIETTCQHVLYSAIPFTRRC